MRRYVVIDTDGHVTAGPFDCVSRAADHWRPCHSFVRGQLEDGSLHLLTEAERAEAWRQLDAERQPA